MKLHAEPKMRRGRAAELLRQEAEPEFDLRAMLLAKTEDIRTELSEAEQKLTPIAFMKGSLYRLAAVRALERTLGVVIIPPSDNRVLDNTLLDQQAHELIIHVGEIDLENIYLDPRRLAVLAAWVQLFPEEQGMIPAIGNQLLEKILNRLQHNTNSLSFIREAVFLLHLRPDMREEIRSVVTPEYFQDFIISQFKEPYLINRGDVAKYTEWLADYLLIHPEDRSRFAPTETERQIIQQALTAGPMLVNPTAGRLRDAAIILGDDASVDERGLIQISYTAPKMGEKNELPVRPQM